jgi:hypothetical protein
LLRSCAFSFCLFRLIWLLMFATGVRLRLRVDAVSGLVCGRRRAAAGTRDGQD